ncbi:MAG: hypothetical protein IJ251_08030 [Oscillospiraceae bacterium]|nr:hypothetical protein [Oscillospiraceae bacterium]
MRHLSKAFKYGSVTLDVKDGYIQRAEPTGNSLRNLSEALTYGSVTLDVKNTYIIAEPYIRSQYTEISERLRALPKGSL